MPRAPRLIPDDGFLHVICRGNNRRKLFFYPRDYSAYYSYVIQFKIKEAIKIFHYCFMPNHIHFLIGLNKDSCLSRFMKRLNLKYFYYYSKKHYYSGHLWSGRFKSKIIKWDEYFIQCGKYIELNPVRAGLVDDPADYPFSSYRYYGLGLADKIVDEDLFYLGLANTDEERKLAYRKMIISGIVNTDILAVK